MSAGTCAHVHGHTHKRKSKIVGNSPAEPVEGGLPCLCLETPFWPILEKGEVSVKSFSFLGVRRVHLEKLHTGRASLMPKSPNPKLLLTNNIKTLHPA